jgi:hypothetical protein
MKFGGFEWDSGNLPKCLGCLAGGDRGPVHGRCLYRARTIVSGERRILGFGRRREPLDFFALIHRHVSDLRNGEDVPIRHCYSTRLRRFYQDIALPPPGTFEQKSRHIDL